MPHKKVFGDYIFKLRMEHGLTLSKVGKMAGISTNYVGELERGQKEPSDEVVRSLAKVYSIHEEKLFAIIGKIPLGIKEEAVTSPELRQLLMNISKNKELSDDIKEKLYKKVREYYESLINEME